VQRHSSMSTSLLDRPVQSASMTAFPSAIPVSELEPYRTALTGYCYRMLGSAFDAEDAVQETMMRAWRHLGDLEDTSSLKAWLYRIATNVCFDSLRATSRRTLPMDLGPASDRPGDPGTAWPEGRWIWPAPDGMVLPAGTDPAETTVSRESVRLAFIAALQYLPARQRAVFILREVLQWSASEVAALMDMSIAAVNSSLQRSRSSMARRNHTSRPVTAVEQHSVLEAYVDAFQRFDLDRLVSLLHLEATLSMPPFDRWLKGPEHFRHWYGGPGARCRGSLLCPVMANGSQAFAQYRPGGQPWALHVVEVANGKITSINCFLEPRRLFPLFGLRI
jgi:RNA polymerase sigma-70 factor, ECF subfamily